MVEFEDKEILNDIEKFCFFAGQLKFKLGGGSSNVKLQDIPDFNMNNMNNPQAKGFVFEAVNNYTDMKNGKSVSWVGQDNAKHGADRLVNGIKIQSKCVKDKNISKLFYRGTKGGLVTKEGHYKYVDGDGKLMLVEVCKGQKAKAVSVMKKQIENGKIKNVKVNEVEKLIVESKFSHQEIEEIADKGKFKFINKSAISPGNYIIGCTLGIGITCCIILGLSLISGNGIIQSMIDAGMALASMTISCGISGISQYAGVFASQSFTLSETTLISTIGYSGAANIVNFFRGITGQGNVYGAAAMKSLTTSLRSLSTIISYSGVVLTVGLIGLFFAVDVGKVIFNKQSIEQLTINTISGAGGMGAGIAGGAIGSGVGTLAGPVGTVAGGIIGGVVGGIAGSVITKSVTNVIVKDDSKVKKKYGERIGIISSDLGRKYWICTDSEIEYLKKSLKKKIKKETKIQKLRKNWSNKKKDFKDLEKCDNYIREIIEPEFQYLFDQKKPIGEDELLGYIKILHQNVLNSKKEKNKVSSISKKPKHKIPPPPKHLLNKKKKVKIIFEKKRIQSKFQDRKKE